MSLLLFILCSYGLTQILVYGSIFNSVRPSKEWLYGFGKLFHCTMCMGFWVGIFLWAINDFTELFTYEYSISTAFLLGCVSSGTSYILNVIFGDEGINLVNGSNY
jgi:hypothetical protein